MSPKLKNTKVQTVNLPLKILNLNSSTHIKFFPYHLHNHSVVYYIIRCLFNDCFAALLPTLHHLKLNVELDSN